MNATHAEVMAALEQGSACTYGKSVIRELGLDLMGLAQMAGEFDVDQLVFFWSRCAPYIKGLPPYRVFAERIIQPMQVINDQITPLWEKLMDDWKDIPPPRMDNPAYVAAREAVEKREQEIINECKAMITREMTKLISEL